MVLVDMEGTVLVLPAMEVTVLDTVSGRDLLMPIPKLGEPLDTDTVPDTVLVDMEVTVLELPAMEVTDLDTVSGRDPQMPIPKLGEPLDTDTVPDTVLVDMEVTVLALPATGVTVLGTVSGRDLLMPKHGVPLDTATVPDMVLVDMAVAVLDLLAMEATDLDTDTESKFFISINVLLFIFDIYSSYLLKQNVIQFNQNPHKLPFGMFHQKLRKSFENDQKENLKTTCLSKMC